MSFSFFLVKTNSRVGKHLKDEKYTSHRFIVKCMILPLKVVTSKIRLQYSFNWFAQPDAFPQ